MQFRNSFDVQADPDRVYAFLLDVTEVITCVPGATLTEVLDGDTYRGKVKLKIGAIVMSYDGKATITDRNPDERSAVLRAEGRETSGSGAAAMEAELGVAEAPSGSAVTIITELTITGRAAQFGRGIIEDVSKRLIGQMASSIKEKLERPPTDDDPGDGARAAASVAPPTGAAPSTPSAAGPRPLPAQEAAPLNVLSLLLSVLRERLARLFRRRRKSSPAGMEPESE